jgi:hypothetical protein
VIKSNKQDTGLSRSPELKGLELSERYFREYGIPMINQKFPDFKDRIAAGLVGDGSECFGYDDDISRDHDWGPGFCLWLNSQDFATTGKSLQTEYDKLPRDYAGYQRVESTWGSGRVGVFDISRFYQNFIGFDHVPANLKEWRVIPEGYLAAATNGKVFIDSSGEFSSFRNQLKAFYPEDIRLKKMASRCMNLAQLGQYNYPRCIRRMEYVAANYAESQFISHAISMVYLINKQYKPFYKWMHRDMKRLPILGATMHDLIQTIVTAHELEFGEQVYLKKMRLIEEASQLIINELKTQGLSKSDSDFLLDHGPVLQSKVQDPDIKNLNVWLE